MASATCFSCAGVACWSVLCSIMPIGTIVSFAADVFGHLGTPRDTSWNFPSPCMTGRRTSCHPGHMPVLIANRPNLIMHNGLRADWGMAPMQRSHAEVEVAIGFASCQLGKGLVWIDDILKTRFQAARHRMLAQHFGKSKRSERATERNQIWFPDAI